MKILAVVAAHLRLIPVRLQCYLDDILVHIGIAIFSQFGHCKIKFFL